jgi:hypothetical protein
MFPLARVLGLLSNRASGVVDAARNPMLKLGSAVTRACAPWNGLCRTVIDQGQDCLGDGSRPRQGATA